MNAERRSSTATTSARRLRQLSVREVLGHRVPVASGAISRLLGLAHLDLARAGTGLLLPRCASVHTFGMRFRLDLVFLDLEGRPLRVERAVGPRRLLSAHGARSVLELPAGTLAGAGGGLGADGVCGDAHAELPEGDTDAPGDG